MFLDPTSFEEKVKSLLHDKPIDRAKEVFPEFFNNDGKYYPLFLRDPYQLQNFDYTKYIDKSILNQLKNNTLKPIIISVTEVFDLFQVHNLYKRRNYKASMPYTNTIKWLLQHNIKEENITFITAIDNVQNDIKFLFSKGIDIKSRFIHYNFFIEQLTFVKKQFRPLKNVEKHFLSLAQNKERHHRYAMTLGLYAKNMMNNGKVSCVDYKNFIYNLTEGSHTVPNINTDNYLKKFNFFSNDTFNNFKNALPLNIDGKVDQHWDYTDEYYLFENVFLNITNESHSPDTKLFATEKTFRPILYCRPFVINGDYGTLDYLHTLGFKTFNKWWDESYDTAPNDWERIENVLKIVETICKLTPSQCMDLYNDMLPIIKHNHELLYSLKQNEKLKKVLQYRANDGLLV